MRKHQIHEWKDIEGDFCEKLLLGNGASRAIWDGFAYTSLYEEAEKADRINSKLRSLFTDYETHDFEYILRILSQANRVNRLLHIKENQTSRLYSKLQTTLMETITAIHPQPENVEAHLPKIADFMKRFHTVLSLNYDLLVYWAMLKGNDIYGKWFKDAFVNEDKFENDFDYLYKPFGANGATLVFYPHGNLILSTDVDGEEIKLTKSDEEYLLPTILSKWKQGYCIPLFVSEGNTVEKLRAIQRSNYLDTVYDQTLQGHSDSLVIYGWSFRDEDEHILRAIVESEPKIIAISVYTRDNDAESYCTRVVYQIRKMRNALKKKSVYKILFFDSSSEGCWNN